MPGPKGTPFTPPGGGKHIDIDVVGLDRLRGNFKTYKAGILAQSNNMVEGIADDIVEVSKDLVAVDTGKTRDSIRKETRDGDIVVLVDRFGERPETPIYLEIGTYRMAARPFLKPAGDIVMSSHGLQRRIISMGGLLAPMRGIGFGR